VGRIVVEARIENGTDPSCRIHCDALVDTGAAYLTLPKAWQARLGQLTLLDTVEVETATQSVVSGDICGPVLLRLEHFRPVLTEVLFIEMEPADGQYEPLIGYIPLEQAQAAVDLVGHRLVKVSRVDLK
jgi:predicted aspartyl protease